MQTYRLASGHTITIQRAGSATEFVTRNAQGEVISTVYRSFSETVPLIKRLRCTAVAI
jgi:hypothetical protein